MSNMVGWFEIYVNDMERAQKFYEEVLDVNLEGMSDPTDQSLIMRSFPGDMTGYGAPGALVKMEGFGPAMGGTIVYFSSKDCLVEESRTEAAGGHIIKPKTAIGEYGYMSLLSDTEGNVIGIHSMN